jgi:hypothetical protein
LATLFTIVEFAIRTSPLTPRWIPPLYDASFPLTVEFVIVKLSVLNAYTPPPAQVAEMTQVEMFWSKVVESIDTSPV